jgi:hypothetical protein
VFQEQLKHEKCYLSTLIIESRIASERKDLFTSLSIDKPRDIIRSFILLSYDLVENSFIETVFKHPQIGNRELHNQVSEHLINHGIVNDFSVYQAASASMSDSEISKSVKYLLLSELAVYCQQVDHVENIESISLIELCYGNDSENKTQLSDLYSSGRIHVANPLIYSAIASDFWNMLNHYVSENEKTKANRHIFDMIRNIVKKRSSFLNDSRIIGYWVECYIRGSFANMTPKAPLYTKIFRSLNAETKGKEVDIVSDIFQVLIECSVRDKDKDDEQVNFNLAYTGLEKCILTTKRTCAAVKMNGLKVLKIPYCMLAAYLDRGEIPQYSDFE